MNSNVSGQGTGLPPQMMQALDRIKPFMNMMNNGQDIRGIEQQLMANNPQFAAFMQMMNGKNPEAMLNEILRSNGVSPEAIMNYLKRPV